MHTILEFIYEPEKILAILTLSKERGTVVGINAPTLGRGTHLTAVENISHEPEVMITLKPYDATGHILDRSRIRLSEVHSVIPFSSVFENPFMRTLSSSNHSFTAINSEL
jgi:hypothetical protein